MYKLKKVLLVVCFIIFSACSNTANVTAGNDPFENINKNVHEFNKSLDTNFLKPASHAYGNSVPKNVRTALSNFSSNLGEPLRFANHALQGNLSKSSVSALRFGLNSTIGLAGLFDIASYINIFSEETTLDDTFMHWNLPAGPYVELPLFGPSSIRGSIAKVVEFSTDPISSSINTAYKFAYYSSVGINVINTRYVLSETIDTVLYDSFDSYNATKNIYFQRFGSISSDSDDESLFTMYSEN